MTTTKFADHKKANARIMSDDHGTYLLSYTTHVCGIRNGLAYCNGLYSATTRRHIGWFAKMCGMTYQDFKFLYDNDLLLDTTTGELIDKFENAEEEQAYYQSRGGNQSA